MPIAKSTGRRLRMSKRKRKGKKPKKNWREILLFIVGFIFMATGLAFTLIKVVYPFLK